MVADNNSKSMFPGEDGKESNGHGALSKFMTEMFVVGGRSFPTLAAAVSHSSDPRAAMRQ